MRRDKRRLDGGCKVIGATHCLKNVRIEYETARESGITARKVETPPWNTGTPSHGP
jgi:hypothetical protein